MEQLAIRSEIDFQPIMSPNIGEIASALSKAQSELESVGKGEEGYGYQYASLPATIQVAKPILAKNNLAITQLVGTDSNNNPSVTTILMHTSGEFIKSHASMPLIEMKGCNEAQRAGAVYSYLRRYALQAILNMSSEDNDASSHGFNKPTVKKSTSKPTQKFRKTKTTTTGGEDDI